jgi:putative peptidoglycan lipid II flippase
VARKTVFITAIFIASTLVQLISQIVVTRIFGASRALDNFLAAVAIPTIVVTVIYGTLNDLVLPFYGTARQRNEDEANGQLLSIIIGFSGLSLVMAAILFLVAPLIITQMYAGSAALDLAEVSRQFSYMVFAFPIAGVATLLGTYYYTHKHYLRFPVAQAIGSVVNLALIILLYQRIGIWALVWAFIVNILLQIPWVIPKIKWRTEKINLWPLIFGWVPLVVANLAIRSDVLIIRSFGAGLGEGYLVYLNLISKVFALSTSLLTVGIQVVLLPNLVEALAAQNRSGANLMVRRAKFVAVGIALVTTLAVFLLAPFVLRLLFLGGKFTIGDLNRTVALLPAFILPAVGWGIASVFFQPLIALKRFRALSAISLVSLAAAWVSASVLTGQGWGVWAISAGLSVLLFGSVLGCEIVWRRSA